ncbi:hypothetical protein HPULCUR_011380 [Helicostylum pulchrum]|uniref:Uncharacterized protein n=1 Tax=Helicostylum pulchrum TaxID=562976 RepID=A0ABP9YFW4_9FUNG
MSAVTRSLQEIKDQLRKFSYWVSVEPVKWELSQFDLSLCGNEPIVKQACHTSLSADIKLFKERHVQDISKNTNRVGVQLKVGILF